MNKFQAVANRRQQEIEALMIDLLALLAIMDTAEPDDIIETASELQQSSLKLFERAYKMSVEPKKIMKI